MRNIILFFRKNYVFFLFLFLEVVSLILFFNFNTYQNAFSYRGTNRIAGAVNNTVNRISEYFYLKQTNRILSEEIAIIRARMPEAIYISDTNAHYRGDTILQNEYRFINAKVISNTTRHRNNYLMINKGEMHGIHPHMGVVVGNKIVGQVVSVSRHFSWILSVLHKDSKISAKFKKNNQLVNVEWPGGNYRIGMVKEIPKHIAVLPGDTIITSGNSEVFPGGILIGVIAEVKEQSDENFNIATIRFLTDFNGLGYIEVVVDLFRQEKENLEASFKEL